MAKRIAVVLFNLGGPDSLNAVKPFLFNLFYDPAIVSLPTPLRWCIAKFISSIRTPKATKIYELMGGKSPILEETNLQAIALQNALSTAHDEYKVWTSMRYWHPFAVDVVKEVKQYRPDKVILLPLYPQFSTSTTGSSKKQWMALAKVHGLDAEHEFICCYPTNVGFIEAYAELVQVEYEKALKLGRPKVLFSAHGLPVRNIKSGDPYQQHVEASVAQIASKLPEGIDYAVCYQSKVGRLEWLGPSTDAEIIAAAKANRPIVVAPIAFVSEHSETLVELDIEYKHLAQQHGASGYFRAPTVGTHHKFIDALAALCINAANNNRQCVRICTKDRTACPTP